MDYTFAMEKPLLFIDGKNILYRSLYASYKNNHHIKYHVFVIFLRQIAGWIRTFKPDSVHVFWDAPRETVWRRDILSTYKTRSGSQYVDGLAKDLASSIEISKAFFDVLNVRQYYKNRMEADDLIYAAVSMAHPKQTIIISTDSDMIQIPFVYRSNKVYNPKKNADVDIPLYHPAMTKALEGDESDSIRGYYGIGPKKSRALLDNQNELQEYITTHDRRIYLRNLLLIDLSLCPNLLSNKIYVQKQMIKPIQFVREKITELITKYSVVGLTSEYANLIPPFKNLI